MNMSNNHNPCLILNADYSPLGVINWQKAITWVFKDISGDTSVSIVNFYKNDSIQSPSISYDLPAVIKLNKYFKFKAHQVSFSRKNVFIRDDFKCQYCGTKYNMGELTYDHVVPKCMWESKREATCWENIVTACVKCNRAKSHNTLQQARMKLLKVPKKPNKSIKYLPVMYHLTKIKSVPDEWNLYLSSYI